MCDKSLLTLVTEIRDLYYRQCQYADRLRELHQANDRRLIDACRPRKNTRIPELQYFATVLDQQDALRKAMRDKEIQSRTRLLHTVAWVGAVTASLALGLGANSALQTVAIVVLLAIEVIVIQHAWLRAPLCRHLRWQLVERGVPICLACGYDLRGTPTRCPECGQPAANQVPPTSKGSSRWPPNP